MLSAAAACSFGPSSIRVGHRLPRSGNLDPAGSNQPAKRRPVRRNLPALDFGPGARLPEPRHAAGGEVAARGGHPDACRLYRARSPFLLRYGSAAAALGVPLTGPRSSQPRALDLETTMRDPAPPPVHLGTSAMRRRSPASASPRP